MIGATSKLRIFVCVFRDVFDGLAALVFHSEVAETRVVVPPRVHLTDTFFDSIWTKLSTAFEYPLRNIVDWHWDCLEHTLLLALLQSSSLAVLREHQAAMSQFFRVILLEQQSDKDDNDDDNDKDHDGPEHTRKWLQRRDQFLAFLQHPWPTNDVFRMALRTGELYDLLDTTIKIHV
jgi:hypothetical protein